MTRGGADPALPNSGDRIDSARASAGASPAREPFKQILCEDLRRLCRDLPPAPLKVWLYHLALTGKRASSYPKLKTIAAETGLHEDTAKNARTWLRENGWLEEAGRVKCRSGYIPDLRPVFPGPKVESARTRRVQNTPSVRGSRVKKTPALRARGVQFTPTEVDFNSEVDRKPEVTGPPRQLSLAGFGTPVIPMAAAEDPERAAQTAASSTPPCPSDANARSFTSAQARYAAIGKLATEGESMLRRRRKSLADADCSEELKQWAATRGVPYDSDAVSKAFAIAEQRIREASAAPAATETVRPASLAAERLREMSAEIEMPAEVRATFLAIAGKLAMPP